MLKSESPECMPHCAGTSPSTEVVVLLPTIDNIVGLSKVGPDVPNTIAIIIPFLN